MTVKSAFEYLPMVLGIVLVLANWVLLPDRAIVWGGVLLMLAAGLAVSIRLAAKPDDDGEGGESAARRIRSALTTAAWTIDVALVASLASLVA